MKTSGWLTALAALLATPLLAGPQYAPPAVIPPPTPLAIQNSKPRPAAAYDYTPRLHSSAPRPQIVTDKQQIADRFTVLYARENKPRLALHVAHTPSSTAPGTETNALPATGVARGPALAREMEEGFRAPWREAGAIFVDPQFASLATIPAGTNHTAELTIDLSMEERDIPIEGRMAKMPVLTATVVHPGDAKVVARASSTVLFGLDQTDPKANHIWLMTRMSPPEIAREVSFALMRDLNHAWTK